MNMAEDVALRVDARKRPRVAAGLYAQGGAVLSLCA
jgi:hypothetical protein